MTYNLCLLYSTKLFKVVSLQTDNTLVLANTIFVAQEQDQLQKAQFAAKECQQLTTANSLKFNSSIIKLKNPRITFT